VDAEYEARITVRPLLLDETVVSVKNYKFTGDEISNRTKRVRR
jgi:hypothetical protein